MATKTIITCDNPNCNKDLGFGEEKLRLSTLRICNSDRDYEICAPSTLDLCHNCFRTYIKRRNKIIEDFNREISLLHFNGLAINKDGN